MSSGKQWREGIAIDDNAIIICGVKIDEYALIGAGPIDTKNISLYALT